MFPAEILRNILKLFQLLSRGFKSSFSLNPSEKSMNQPGANRPIPVAHRNICPHCKLDIPDGARVCHHCHQFVSVRFNLANVITIIVSVAAVAMSVYSLYMTASQATVAKNIESRRFLIETLHSMQQVQDELQMSHGKPGSEDNLSEKQILLLNYYEVLSRTLAQYIKQEPSLFVRMRCTYEPSIRMRQSPSTKSKQLGTVYKDEEVFRLGNFPDSKGDMWYYVASADQQKIGWIYKYLEIVQ
ncbi:MAG: SH3 domain-containing protein [Bacteroidota bacterium]